MQYQQGLFEPVDFVFSYSSLEHDGLGRYGDPLNPYADLETLARIRCLLVDGGTLLLGIPNGKDYLVWNAHRVYGRLRMRMLLSLGWEVSDRCYKWTLLHVHVALYPLQLPDPFFLYPPTFFCCIPNPSRLSSSH